MNNKPIRGFSHLIGETIKEIDARGINHITFFCASGKIVAVAADEYHYGIPVISCTEMETQFKAKVAK